MCVYVRVPCIIITRSQTICDYVKDGMAGSSVCARISLCTMCMRSVVVPQVSWSAVIQCLFCVCTLEIDALNRKRQQLTQDFKRKQDEYLAVKEVQRERERQERERKVEEKKLKEVEKKSRETLSKRCVHIQYILFVVCASSPLSLPLSLSV